MKRLRTPLASILFSLLVLSACGSSTQVGTAAEDPDGTEVPVVDEPVEEDPDGAEAPVQESLPVVDEPVEEDPDGAEAPVQDSLPVIDEPIIEDAGEHVITNDVIVDPQVTTPIELVLSPDDDTVLWVRFVGGDPNCTAAAATLFTETPEAVDVELQVGLTEDALTRSCMAGEFNLRVELQLSESATGKTLSASQATEPGRPPAVTPDLTTDSFIGLSEAEAAAIADENGIAWRTVRIDDEDFMVTMDYNPGRLNFAIDDGVITAVSLG